MIINKYKTCAITGHRQIDLDLDYKYLERVLEQIIKKGFDTFLIGMAIGFDTICFKMLYKLKQKYDIKLVACVPFPEQAEKFSISQKEEYESLLEKADHIEIISQKYYKGCMRKRNEFMIDNAIALVAYAKKEKSGAMQTYNMAIKKGLAVLKI